MEIYPVNLTLSIVFNKSFDLEKIYELLPCVKVHKYIFKGKKIPFFGINDIFIGIKSHEWGSRGIRCDSNDSEITGAMKNCVSLDLQCNDSNFNIKIYSNLFHIGGIASNKIGEDVAINLTKLLNTINLIWLPFFSMNGENRYKFINEILIPIISVNGFLMNIKDIHVINSFNNVKDKIGNLVDALRILISFIEWYPTLEIYLIKIAKISSFTLYGNNILTNGYDIQIHEINNLEGIYIGKIPFDDILLGYITEQLLSLKLDASFLNEKSRSLKICTLTGLENFKIKKTNSKVPMHKIVIQDSGNVRVTSPGNPELVLNESIRIMNIICDLIKSNNYPIMSQDNISYRMMEILSKFIDSNSNNTLTIQNNNQNIFL